MRHFLIAIMLAAVAAYAEDHVTIRYTPGNSRSAQSVVVTIGRAYDKSDKLVPAVFEKLEAIDKLERTSFVVPDSGYVTIVAEKDGRRLESSSCHTLFEANPNLVALSGGVTILDGKTRREALADAPEDFLEFRRLWEEALALSMKTVNATLAP